MRVKETRERHERADCVPGTIFAFSCSSQAKIWNIRQCKLLFTLVGHTGCVFCVDLDEECRRAFTGSGDRVSRKKLSRLRLILLCWLLQCAICICICVCVCVVIVFVFVLLLLLLFVSLSMHTLSCNLNLFISLPCFFFFCLLIYFFCN